MRTLKSSPFICLLPIIVISCVLIFGEAKILDQDRNDCEDEDTSGPCIDCEIKKMSSASLMLSEATMKFFDTKDNLKSKKHSKDNLQILHCKCLKPSVGYYF